MEYIERRNSDGTVIARSGPFPEGSDDSRRAELLHHHIAELHNRSRPRAEDRQLVWHRPLEDHP